MPFVSSLSLRDVATFIKVVDDSLQIRSHRDLFDWLHDEVQVFVPHDVLIAAWGDFNLGLVHLDVISYLPGVRTTEVDRQGLMPAMLELFRCWIARERRPFVMPLGGANEDAFCFRALNSRSVLEKSVLAMRTALVHGIKDERGRHDCLYIALSERAEVSAQTVDALEVLLPHVDAALRQVTHLPVQYGEFPGFALGGEIAATLAAAAPAGDPQEADGDLSGREMEIMRWVSLGKTNPEIGMILNISAFTVKNHMQRIFRKLDVLNRAQAVSRFQRLGNPPHGNE